MGKRKKGLQEVYSVKPFTNFCHPIKKKKYNFKSNKDIDKKNFSLLVSGGGTSALARFVEKAVNPGVPLMKMRGDEGAQMERSSLFSCDVEKIINKMSEKQFFSNNEISLENLQPCCRLIIQNLSKVDVLKVAYYTSQGSEAWKKERQLRITGSTCYAIYTYGSRGNIDWQNKTNNFFFPKGFKNKFTEHAQRYEKEALEAFKEKNHCHIVTPSLIVAKCLPWLAFSPDGVIFEEGIPTSLLEIKCPYIGREQGPDTFFEYCDYLEKVHLELRLKVNHNYNGQVQFGMALLNLK